MLYGWAALLLCLVSFNDSCAVLSVCSRFVNVRVKSCSNNLSFIYCSCYYQCHSKRILMITEKPSSDYEVIVLWVFDPVWQRGPVIPMKSKRRHYLNLMIDPLSMAPSPQTGWTSVIPVPLPSFLFRRTNLPCASTFLFSLRNRSNFLISCCIVFLTSTDFNMSVRLLAQCKMGVCGLLAYI